MCRVWHGWELSKDQWDEIRRVATILEELPAITPRHKAGSIMTVTEALMPDEAGSIRELVVAGLELDETDDDHAWDPAGTAARASAVAPPPPPPRAAPDEEDVEMDNSPWSAYATIHDIGDVVTGTVASLSTFGVFVELGPEIQGHVHVSEMGNPPPSAPSEVVSEGQIVVGRITALDAHRKILALTMVGVAQPKQEPASSGVATTPPNTVIPAALAFLNEDVGGSMGASEEAVARMMAGKAPTKSPSSEGADSGEVGGLMSMSASEEVLARMMTRKAPTKSPSSEGADPPRPASTPPPVSQGEREEIVVPDEPPGQPEESDEDTRRASRSLRYRLMEALEEDGWKLQISGDSILIGASKVNLDVEDPTWFRLYRAIGNPDFRAVEDINMANGFLPVAAFLASYKSVGGDVMWGSFLRLPAPPEGIPPKALGKWLTSMVSSVAVLAKVHDADVAD